MSGETSDEDRTPARPHRSEQRVARALGVAGTLGLHGVVLLVLHLPTFLPENPFDFDLVDPRTISELEIGVETRASRDTPDPQSNNAAVGLEQGASAGTVEVAPPRPSSAATSNNSAGASPPRSRPPRRTNVPRSVWSNARRRSASLARAEPDAGVDVEDAGVDEDASAVASIGDGGEPVASIADGDVDDGSAPVFARTPRGDPVLTGFGDRGALVTFLLRADRVRASPFEAEVRTMIRRVPDYRRLLAGSELDPIRDLDAVLLATPNPWDGRRLALLARYTVQDSRLEAMLAAAQQAAGQDASVFAPNDAGLRVAPAPSVDGTRRTVALLGQRTVAVARPRDLPRLLAIAEMRENRGVEAGDEDEDAGADRAEQPQGLDAARDRFAPLFAARGEGGASPLAVLEADGVRRYMTKQRGLPSAARFVLSTRPEGGTRLSGTGWYDSPAQAQVALRHWQQRRNEFIGNAFNRVFFRSLVAAMRSARIRADYDTIRVEAELDTSEARRLMRLAAAIFAARPLGDGGVGDGGVAPARRPRDASTAMPSR